MDASDRCKMQVLAHMAPSKERDYLDGVAFRDIILPRVRYTPNTRANLTDMLKPFCNNVSTRYIAANILNDKSALDTTHMIKLCDPKTLQYLQKISRLEPSVMGYFLEYVFVRLTHEMLGKPIRNTQTFTHDCRKQPYMCRYDIQTFVRIDIPLCHIKCKKDVNDVENKTADLLPQMLICALERIAGFGGVPKQDNIHQILDELTHENTQQQLINPMITMINKLFANKNNDLHGNTELGCIIPKLGIKIRSDCDIIYGDMMIDIKCSNYTGFKAHNKLQLLGYSSIINCCPQLIKKIGKIRKCAKLNLFNGIIEIIEMDGITDEMMLNYLKLLIDEYDDRFSIGCAKIRRDSRVIDVQYRNLKFDHTMIMQQFDQDKNNRCAMKPAAPRCHNT